MDDILKNDIFRGPHMPGNDLNPIRENMKQFLKIDFVQPTPNMTGESLSLILLKSLNNLSQILGVTLITDLGSIDNDCICSLVLHCKMVRPTTLLLGLENKYDVDLMEMFGAFGG